MSADNFVGVMRNKATGKWHVWDGSASCEYMEPPEPSPEYPSWCRVFDTEKEAIEHAHEQEVSSYYEYGVHVFPEHGQHVKGPPDHVTEAVRAMDDEPERLFGNTIRWAIRTVRNYFRK